MKNFFKSELETVHYSHITGICKQYRLVYVAGGAFVFDNREAELEEIEKGWLAWIERQEGELLVAVTEERIGSPVPSYIGLITSEERLLADYISKAYRNYCGENIHPDNGKILDNLALNAAKDFFKDNKLEEAKTLKDAVQKLAAALKEDPEFFEVYAANITTAVSETFASLAGCLVQNEDLHKAAKKSAIRFLNFFTEQAPAGKPMISRPEYITNNKNNFLQICSEIGKERQRQDAKFGAQRDLNPLVWLAILGEEVGEANEAVVENYFSGDGKHKGGTLEAYRKELIQVAAVAVAAVQSYDLQKSNK